MSECKRDGCPAWHVRNPQTNRCIHRKKRTYQCECVIPRKKCERDGCPAWRVRSPRTNRCIHRKKQAYQCDCVSPRQKAKKAKPSSPKKAKKASPIVKLLDNIEDITSVDEVQDYIDSSDPSSAGPSTYLEGDWWSIPKVLRSGSRTFVPTKILGRGGFGVVFAYKEEGEEKQPSTTQNTIALKLVNGKSATDSDCKGTLDYFPKSLNVSQICKGVIYQRCISPKGLKVVPMHGDVSSDKLSFYIVMELMDGDITHLQDFLTPAAQKKVVLELKEALMCLLKHKRYYADLWGANVFFTYSKHYKGSGPVNPKDIGTIKLGDLASICKKNKIKPAYFVPPSQWKAFGGIGWRAPCTEDTMVWQFAAFVLELYTGRRVGGLEEDKRDFIQDRLTRLRKELTSKNFPKLPISKFKEVFNLDLNSLQKNRVRLKNLFN